MMLRLVDNDDGTPHVADLALTLTVYEDGDIAHTIRLMGPVTEAEITYDPKTGVTTATFVAHAEPVKRSEPGELHYHRIYLHEVT